MTQIQAEVIQAWNRSKLPCGCRACSRSGKPLRTKEKSASAFGGTKPPIGAEYPGTPSPASAIGRFGPPRKQLRCVIKWRLRIVSQVRNESICRISRRLSAPNANVIRPLRPILLFSDLSTSSRIRFSNFGLAGHAATKLSMGTGTAPSRS